MEAGWLITPDNKLPVSLSFSFFETEENHDVLRIYDGGDKNAPLLAEFSGGLSNIDSLVTGTGDSLWVTFSSDEQIQGAGFNAQYCTTPPEGDFIVEGEAQPCSGTDEIYLVSGQDGTRFQWTPPQGWELRERASNSVELSIGTGNGLLELIPFNRCGESALVAMEPWNHFLRLPIIQGFSGIRFIVAVNREVLRWIVSRVPPTNGCFLPNGRVAASPMKSTFIPGAKPGLC